VLIASRKKSVGAKPNNRNDKTDERNISPTSNPLGFPSTLIFKQERSKKSQSRKRDESRDPLLEVPRERIHTEHKHADYNHENPKHVSLNKSFHHNTSKA